MQAQNWAPKLWIAILLGAIFPPFTYLYLNRVKLFLLFFLLVAGVTLVDLFLGSFYVNAFSLICPIYAFFIIKKGKSFGPRIWYSKLSSILGIIVCLLSVLFLTRSFFYEPFFIPSSSMTPTINKGDLILVKKLGFGNYGTYGIPLLSPKSVDPKSMEVGKNYAFYHPNKDVSYVKRLIGVPGDSIEYKNGRLKVNGELLEREFRYYIGNADVYQEELKGLKYDIQIMNESRNLLEGTYKVPLDSYFFMGDNRDNSADSRLWGVVKSDRIIGELVFVLGGK